MLYETVKDYSIVKALVKYVKTAEKIAEMEKNLQDLKKDLGAESPFVVVATAKLKEAKIDAKDTLALADKYEKLKDSDKDLITLAMGRFTSALAESEAFGKELENCINRLQNNTIDATTVKRLIKSAGDAMDIKIKPYRGVNETILEGFKASRYTGLRLGKNDPVKFAKRTAKQWEAQIALYIYASIQES